MSPKREQLMVGGHGPIRFWRARPCRVTELPLGPFQSQRVAAATASWDNSVRAGKAPARPQAFLPNEPNCGTAEWEFHGSPMFAYVRLCSPKFAYVRLTMKKLFRDRRRERPAAASEAGVGEGRFRERAEVFGGLGSLLRCEPPPRALTCRAGAGRVAPFNREIGRASCRERV